MARLARSAARRAGVAWRPALAYGLAALLAAFALTMAASPDARSAVLEWLGLKSVQDRAARAHAPPPRRAARRRPRARHAGHARRGPPPRAVPAPARRGRARRPRRRLRSARTASRSSTASAPVYARSTTTGAALLVQEFRARVGPFIEKTVGERRAARAPARRRRPRVLHHRRARLRLQRDGQVDFEDQRLAGNTLLVERADGLLIRVEGDLARDRAVGDRASRSVVDVTPDPAQRVASAPAAPPAAPGSSPATAPISEPPRAAARRASAARRHDRAPALARPRSPR